MVIYVLIQDTYTINLKLYYTSDKRTYSVWGTDTPEQAALEDGQVLEWVTGYRL